MNTMRDRILTMLRVECAAYANCDDCDKSCKMINNQADKLLAAGVILPKFRVNQEVYVRTAEGEIQRRNVAGYYDFGGQKGVYLNGDMYSTDSKHIFATEAEALAALEGKE